MTITIVNISPAVVGDTSWLDVYLALDAPPDINKPWPNKVTSHPVIWELSRADLPIMPDESGMLTLANAIQLYDNQQLPSDPPYPVGVTVYEYIDSESLGSSVTAVAESDESNILFSPIISEAGGVTTLTVSPS